MIYPTKFPGTIKFMLNKKVHTPPSCSDCKYNYKNKNESFCTLFKYLDVMTEDRTFNYYVHSEICRNETEFCGPDGKYFKAF